MSDWSHGYNVSSGYTYGFYRELAPDWLDFCALIQGYLAPQRGPKGAFRYLELGSGQGLGLCLIAAANPSGQYVGIDFNPEHIAHANQLAASAGLKNVTFIEGDFAALGANWPTELGVFDYITLHGIYSWIPESVRDGLAACIGAAAGPGSLVYVSYNAMPGWLQAVPFQHLARRVQLATARNGPDALQETVKLFEAMQSANSPLHRALPGLKARLDNVKSQNKSYLVQEYLHDNWHPLWFSQVASELGRHKLSFIGSAHLPEALMPALLPPAMRDIVNGQQDPVLRQDVMDCVMNQGFRRDVFCRGPRRHFGRTAGPLLDLKVRLGAKPSDPEVKIATSVGEAKLAAVNVTPILDALAQGNSTVGQLASLSTLPKNNLNAHVQTIILLVHAGILQLMPSGDQSADIAQRLNAEIARAAAEGAPYTHVAAPEIGSAVQASDVDLIFLKAWIKNPRLDAGGLGKALAEGLTALGRGLSREGNALTGDPLNERIGELASAFIANTVPRWKSLGVIR